MRLLDQFDRFTHTAVKGADVAVKGEGDSFAEADRYRELGEFSVFPCKGEKVAAGEPHAL